MGVVDVHTLQRPRPRGHEYGADQLGASGVFGAVGHSRVVQDGLGQVGVGQDGQGKVDRMQIKTTQVESRKPNLASIRHRRNHLQHFLPRKFNHRPSVDVFGNRVRQAHGVAFAALSLPAVGSRR